MVRVRKNRVSQIEEVQTQGREARKQARRAFLQRTEGKVWDEETSQWVTSLELLEMAGDSVIAENEYWDNLPDEEES